MFLFKRKLISNINVNAFTLAEVLITIAVIGVIAAMTIPSLIEYYEKETFITAYKKAFTTLSQATKLLAADNGGTMRDIMPVSDHHTWQVLYAAKLKTAKSCPDGSSECYYGDIWKSLDGSDPWYAMSPSGLILDDGMYMGFFTGDVSTCITMSERALGDTSNSSVCAFITVDINGPKGPNRMGKDIHRFLALSDGLAPYDSCPGIAPTGDCCNLNKTPDASYRGITCGVEILQDNLDWNN